MKQFYLIVFIFFWLTNISKGQEIALDTTKLQLDSKKKRTFKESIYIGVNYRFIHTPSQEFKDAFSNMDLSSDINQFGVSFYAPIGRYILIDVGYLLFVKGEVAFLFR